MREVILYSRRGCHLCEEMLEQVEPLCRGLADIVVRDVDTDAEWRESFGLEVPVLFVGATEACRHVFNRERFLTLLNDGARRVAE